MQNVLLEQAKVYEEEFETAMSDDFNTALATSSMFGLAKEINIYYQVVTGREGVVCQDVIAEVKTYLQIYDRGHWRIRKSLGRKHGR